MAPRNFVILLSALNFFILSVDLSEGRECFGTNSELSMLKDHKSHYEKLRERYANCTVVRGNLEITGIDTSDVDFLKDIEIVTGYVIIALNRCPHVPLEKLRIIRGQELYRKKYSLYIGVNYKDTPIAPNGLTELRFKSLTEIQRGSVYLKQNPRLCFEDTVDWYDIINPIGRKRYGYNYTIEGDGEKKCPKCHSSCPGGCWGKGPNMCQDLTLNCSSKCGDARCRGPGPDDCCDRECAAGCTGPTDRDCIICLNVNNSGVCESSCPPKTLYDQLEARVVPNPDFKYHYHDQCVDTCPSNLLVEGNSCVKSCQRGFTNNGDGFCVPCTPELCKKECFGVGNKGGPLGNADTVDASNIHHFENCTIVNGNVVFQAYAFAGDEHKGIPPLSAESLSKAFRNVKTITGYLEILSWPKNLTDLSVLENLEEIQGVDLFRDIVALLIQDSISAKGPFSLDHVKSLGFRSLRSIKHGNVYVGYLKKLCYIKTIKWNKIIKNPIQYKNFHEDGFLFRFLPSPSDCEQCDYRCSLDGCWGPTQFDCMSCQQYSYKNECLATCPKERGFYTNEGDMSCQDCHPECNGSCDGPGETMCTSCKHYQDNGVCVTSCPVNKYADPITSVCMPCHENCYTGETLKSPLCSGPNETLGNSGCEHCEVVSVNRNFHVQSCLPIFSMCPEGYFQSEGVSQSFRSCVPCYDGCNNCTGSKKEHCAHIIPGDGNEVLIASILTIVIVLVVIIMIACFWKRRTDMRKRRANSMRALGLDSQLPDNQAMNPKGCLMEPMTPSGVPPNQAQLRIMKDSELSIGKILGSGAFGTVHKGYWIPSLAGREKVKVPVAIKVLKDDSSHFASTEILDEAFLMASCEHPNLVRLLGISLSQRIMLITQLMPLGNLLEYVRVNQDNIGSHHLLNWCSQIAQGMNYLSKEKHLVHRDLAARNVLVKSPNHVRITDFGLAKLLDVNEDVYRAEGGKMPIKWLALESIQRREFTHKSDVWSYGVTVWELMTFGKKPYENVPAREVHKLLEKGERLLQPAICTIDVYMLMIKCWTVDVDARPTFQELFEEFSKMARDPSRYLVNKNDGELTDLPSPTTSEFLRKWADEDGDDFDLQDAEQYLNPTAEELTASSNNSSKFPLQPAPPRAQWRRNYQEHDSGNSARSLLHYGRLNTSSTDSSADNRLDSAMTTMTGLPSVGGSMYPAGTSTPFPSVTGHSPATPRNIIPSLNGSTNGLSYLQDEQPGTSGLTNHNHSKPVMRNHSDSSDVFYNPTHMHKGAASDSPWVMQQGRPAHPGISRAREDSANQRYSAEPILYNRQQTRPNENESGVGDKELAQDDNGYLEPSVEAIKPEYLDPTNFSNSPFSLVQDPFFTDKANEDKAAFENPDYEPTFLPQLEIGPMQGSQVPNVKYSASTDEAGYEIPMTSTETYDNVPNDYQNLAANQNPQFDRNDSNSGSSMSSEKRDSGLQSEGDEENTRNAKDSNVVLVPKQHINNDTSSVSFEASDNTVVENPNYELLENMTTDTIQNDEPSHTDANHNEPEYINDPNLFISGSLKLNNGELGEKNSNKLTVNCPGSEDDDDIFITPESRRRNGPYTKLDSDENVLGNGYNRTYSEPDSGVGIEIGVDNMLYHRLGSTGYDGNES